MSNYHFQALDGVEFKLKAPFDFSFLKKYGRVFKIFDDQDSGNICFGCERDGERLFLKFAGAPTAEYNGTPADAIERLKTAVPIYESLKHPGLIEYLDSEEIGGGFAMLFRWTDGECMARMYPESHKKFVMLPTASKLNVYNDIMSFFDYISKSGYQAVDFYDGSIMYDFANEKTVICDIDYFRKAPFINDMGRMWGSSLFMSPEEQTLGALIDEITNVYTLGATAFALFGNFERTKDKWELGGKLFDTASRAVSAERAARQQSIVEFIDEWKNFE